MYVYYYLHCVIQLVLFLQWTQLTRAVECVNQQGGVYDVSWDKACHIEYNKETREVLARGNTASIVWLGGRDKLYCNDDDDVHDDDYGDNLVTCYCRTDRCNADIPVSHNRTDIPRPRVMHMTCKVDNGTLEEDRCVTCTRVRFRSSREPMYGCWKEGVYGEPNGCVLVSESESGLESGLEYKDEKEVCICSTENSCEPPEHPYESDEGNKGDDSSSSAKPGKTSESAASGVTSNSSKSDPERQDEDEPSCAAKIAGKILITIVCIIGMFGLS